MATARSRLAVVEGGKPGKPKSASEALGAQSDEFLECRDLRHPWSSVGLFYVGREVRRRLVCSRCGTEATDRWTAKGKRIARQYKYAAGYQAKGIKIKPTDVRREVMNRVTVYASEQDMVAGLFGNVKQA